MTKTEVINKLIELAKANIEDDFLWTARDILDIIIKIKTMEEK